MDAITQDTTEFGAELITVPAAARLLGYSRWSVYALISSGRLPAYQLGGRNVLRVKRSDLAGLLTRVVPKHPMAAAVTATATAVAEEG
jgi:excisionase family DNA binding protein